MLIKTRLLIKHFAWSSEIAAEFERYKELIYLHLMNYLRMASNKVIFWIRNTIQSWIFKKIVLPLPLLPQQTSSTKRFCGCAFSEVAVVALHTYAHTYANWYVNKLCFCLLSKVLPIYFLNIYFGSANIKIGCTSGCIIFQKIQFMSNTKRKYKYNLICFGINTFQVTIIVFLVDWLDNKLIW